MTDVSIQIVSRTADGGERHSTITGPDGLARLGVQLRRQSEELAAVLADPGARARLHRTHVRAVQQVERAVSGALAAELDALGVLEVPDPESASGLRLAHAQLLGWLQGLFQQLNEAAGADDGPEGEAAEAAAARGEPDGAA
jgi:hypothetical protein